MVRVVQIRGTWLQLICYALLTHWSLILNLERAELLELLGLLAQVLLVGVSISDTLAFEPRVMVSASLSLGHACDWFPELPVHDH